MGLSDVTHFCLAFLRKLLTNYVSNYHTDLNKCAGKGGGGNLKTIEVKSKVQEQSYLFSLSSPKNGKVQILAMILK